MSKDFTIEVTVDKETGVETATVHHGKPSKKKLTKKETPEVQQ
jgi:hypothetical protein